VPRALNTSYPSSSRKHSTIRFSNIIAGLQWVKDKVKATGRPSVVLLAVGGYHSPALNRNIDSVVRSGTPVVVSSTTLLKQPDEPANRYRPEMVRMGNQVSY
jgi:hypothetical protein